MNEERVCQTCAHFRQHYIKLGRSYRELWYGHCVFPRLKNRKIDKKACERYCEHYKNHCK